MVWLRQDSTGDVVRSISLNNTLLLWVKVLQDGSSAERFLDAFKCVLLWHLPFEGNVLLGQSCEWGCKLGKVFDKSPVEVCKRNEALHFFETGRRLPLLDGVSLGWVHAHRSGSAVFSGRLDDEAKVLDLMHFKVALGDVNLQACIS